MQARIYIIFLCLCLFNCSKIDLDPEIDDINHYSNCYINFTNSDLNRFEVFVRNQTDSNYYFGFEISHEKDESFEIKTDQYRLRRGKIYLLEGKKMKYTGLDVLENGESEFTYRSTNKVDFTGGIHGDEKLTKINFFIDGVRLDINDSQESFNYLACNSFSYIQESNMYETISKNGRNDTQHVIEAIHYKETTFSNSGYETINRIIWKKNIKILVGYLSISAISTDMAEFCQSRNYDIIKLDRLGGHKLEEVNNYVHLWNETNSTSVFINSEFNLRNDSSTQFIWDIERYSKYYRDIAFNNPIIVNNGDEWFSTTIVRFNIK